MQGKNAQEAQAFKSLQHGQERQILMRQNSRLMQQYLSQIEGLSDKQIIADANKSQIKNKVPQSLFRLNLTSFTMKGKKRTTKMQKLYSNRTMWQEL